MSNKVAILIGSETDRDTMEAANKYYEYFSIDYEIKVLSAHRDPESVHDFSLNARSNGYKIIPQCFFFHRSVIYPSQVCTAGHVRTLPLPGSRLD